MLGVLSAQSPGCAIFTHTSGLSLSTEPTQPALRKTRATGLAQRRETCAEEAVSCVSLASCLKDVSARLHSHCFDSTHHWPQKKQNGEAAVSTFRGSQSAVRYQRDSAMVPKMTEWTELGIIWERFQPRLGQVFAFPGRCPKIPWRSDPLSHDVRY